MGLPMPLRASASLSILVTGGAGYIGSLLTGVLLNQGHKVTVVDDLLFGGESLLGYWHHPRFRFVKGDVCNSELFEVQGSTLKVGELTPSPFDAVVHLAAIVAFPACQAVGRQVAWRYNGEATQRVFEVAEAAGVRRFIFASTYSNYGASKDGQPVSEESPRAEARGPPESHLKDLTFGGDMRDIAVSFAKIRQALEFEPQRSMEQGIIEVRDALAHGLIKGGTDSRYRNAQFIVQ